MDSDASTLVGALILAFLLIVLFLFTAVASALRSITDSELEEAFASEARPPDEQEHKKALVETLQDQEGMLQQAIWLTGILSFVGIGILIRHLAAQYPWYVLILAAAILLYLFGASVPDMIGRKRAAKWLTGHAGFVCTALKGAAPVLYVLTTLSNLCVRLVGIDPHSQEAEVTEDEIISMVNEGHEQGVLDAREAEMIQNIFEMDDKMAGDIMTHRKNVIGISGTINLNEAISFMVEQTVSRFPVYEEGIDNVLGILHFKDAMKFHTMNTYDNWLIRDIPGLLRPVRFIPETRGISLLLKSMQSEKLQMVMVADEYGQTAGLVTLEDILEEIVGNIQDEYDKDIQFIQKTEDGFWMDGMTPLPEVGETLGIQFEGEEYDTLNGWLISRLDRILADDEQADIEEQGYLFHISEVENKMIHLVKITKLPEEKSIEEEKE